MLKLMVYAPSELQQWILSAIVQWTSILGQFALDWKDVEHFWKFIWIHSKIPYPNIPNVFV